MTETTFDPNGLEPATTYYWRVDELLGGNAIQTGPVWTFTTFLPVDDFESYTDDEGSRIYQTWIDGLADGSSGSTVGYVDAPFAEQKTVHGGLQAMPLDYNNIEAPFFSEAERQFDPAQDWTVHDVNTLVLYFRGRTLNSPDRLYVALEDASKHRAVVELPRGGQVGRRCQVDRLEDSVERICRRGPGPHPEDEHRPAAGTTRVPAARD